MVLIENTNVKRDNKGKERKKKNKGINRRKETLIKKASKLGELYSINVALIIYKHSQYTTYRSRDYI